MRFGDSELRRRLAMLALVGFVFQHLAYPGTGPVENLVAHVADPYHVTCVSGGIPFVCCPSDSLLYSEPDLFVAAERLITFNWPYLDQSRAPGF
jgi:hypothetical protein